MRPAALRVPEEKESQGEAAMTGAADTAATLATTACNQSGDGAGGVRLAEETVEVAACWIRWAVASLAKTARREAEKVQELAQSWRCHARGNGPEPRQHWRSGQKKIPTDKGWDFGYWWWGDTPSQTPLKQGLQCCTNCRKFRKKLADPTMLSTR
jgi:hypothetical protein